MISAAAIDIIERARAVPIEQIIEAHGIKLRGRFERVGACPRCGGFDRFAINTRKQLWNCRGCRQGGDAIALARFLDGSGFREACATLAGQDWGREEEATATKRQLSVSLAAAVNRIWREAESPLGTLAETYLRDQRKLVVPPELMGAVLRFHPSCPWRNEHVIGYVPALIAPFRSIDTDAITAIHRIALNADGSKLGRRMLGTVAGSAIKLDPAGDHLVIGEGLETCLAARQLGLHPVWALGSAGGIENLAPINGVEELVILGENDSGQYQTAATKCRDRWKQSRVLLITPQRGKDLNDFLLEHGNDFAS